MIFLKIKEKKTNKTDEDKKNTLIRLQEYRQPYAKHFSIFNLRSTYLLLALKNTGFIARMMNLFISLHYRNRRYGNDHYDKSCRYEIF